MQASDERPMRKLRDDLSMYTRAALMTDAAACAAIYAPYVTGTAITFEMEPPDEAEMRRRIKKSLSWLVAEQEGEVVGYAYAGPYKERPAYRWACEVSVYLDGDHRGRGLGRELYADLFDRLESMGLRMLVAGVTLPNPASVKLHQNLGFQPVGTWRRIGWKLGAWHDVHWLQRPIGADVDPPGEPTISA
jgi:phosphinothricin acetyltransferase